MASNILARLKTTISPLAWAFTLFIFSALITATAVKPKNFWADQREVVLSEQLIPNQFADWQRVEGGSDLLVNPELTQLINKLYNLVISRTYIDANGNKVMLSIAYGKDQRDGLQLHDPEVCYPAQGFFVKNKGKKEISTSDINITLRQLDTENRVGRREFVSYWTLVGKRIVDGRFDKKMAELELALTGYIADGLIFRVSTIGVDAKSATHERFIQDLLGSMDDDSKLLIVGSTTL